MYKLKDAVWVIDLGDELKGEVVRQLTDILQYEPCISEAKTGHLDFVVRAGKNDGFVGPDDHAITTADTGETRCVHITGKTEKGAVYGVFSLLEELGYYFLPSGTLRPEDGPGTPVTEINKTFCTSNKWRGIYVSFFTVSTSIMSVADFADLFDSMLRMKMNRIVFYHFENEPIVDYTFRGERKVVGDISRPESGYFSYGRNWTGSYNTEEITVGRECFGERKRVAPMEFQDTATSDEALDEGRKYINNIIKEASVRQIGVWISFLPQFVSMNMAKYVRAMPRKNLHWSALVSCTDPVVREINAARIKGMVDAYPGLEGIFVSIPEGFYEDPYEESEAFIQSRMPEYKEALDLQKKYWGDHWPGDELQRKHIEADIAFSRIAMDALDELAKYKKEVKRGLLTICKAYLLTKLHEILPGDIAFCDIESRSLWTHGGAPLFLFQRMEGRECSIIPRITDDGSQAGMQFNLNLYHKDGYCRSAVENKTTGLMMQTLFINGADHNIKYLAEGLWNPGIHPESFYGEYLDRVFGIEAAVDIGRAYRLLEENEEFMGGRGAANMPWNNVPPEIAVMRGFMNFANPYHECPVSSEFSDNSIKRAEIYQKTIKTLETAAGIFRQNIERCSLQGKPICKYMMTRTRAYMHHLEALVILSGLYTDFRTAFDRGEVKDNLGKLCESAAFAHAAAVKSAGLFAECATHTTDLAPLWMINSSMVKGTEVLGQYLGNILAYHEGREYWNPVAWETLFGECPYPAHGIIIRPEESEAVYEPG